MPREIVGVDVWVLIVVSLMFASGIGGSEGVSSVTFREFRNKKSCEEAKKFVFESAEAKHVKVKCVQDQEN